jgi:hypothetical protein
MRGSHESSVFSGAWEAGTAQAGLLIPCSSETHLQYWMELVHEGTGHGQVGDTEALYIQDIKSEPQWSFQISSKFLCYKKKYIFRKHESLGALSPQTPWKCPRLTSLGQEFLERKIKREFCVMFKECPECGSSVSMTIY